VGDGWAIWDNHNAWSLRSGKIGYDVSSEVDGQELSMIKPFEHHDGPLGGPWTTWTASPRSNGVEQPGNQ
jgi:hypothetical protein